MSRYVVQDMTESARPRAAEQPRKTTLSAGGPETRATLLWVSLFLASGSCGCSTVRVDRRPSTRHQQSRQGTTRAARMFTAESRRIAIETASVLRTSDALPQNCSNGSKGMLFSVDRLFHRRSCIVVYTCINKDDPAELPSLFFLKLQIGRKAGRRKGAR